MSSSQPALAPKRHWLTRDKLRPLLDKLSSELPSVRSAALDSLVFKLHHGLVVPAQLVHEASLPPALLSWFNFDNVVLPRKALELMATLTNSHPKVFGFALLRAGAVPFLNALRPDLPPFCIPQVDALRDALLHLEPQLLLAPPPQPASHQAKLESLPGSKAYAELTTLLRPRARLPDDDAGFASSMDDLLRTLPPADVDALLAAGDALCRDAPGPLLEALHDFESRIVFDYPPLAVLAAGTPLQGLISLLINTGSPDVATHYDLELLALRCLTAWLDRTSAALSLARAALDYAPAASAPGPSPFAPPVLGLLHNTLARILTRLAPLAAASRLHAPVCAALAPALALYARVLALLPRQQLAALARPAAASLASALAAHLDSPHTSPLLVHITADVIDVWLTAHLVADGTSLDPALDAALIQLVLDAELHQALDPAKTTFASYLVAVNAPSVEALQLLDSVRSALEVLASLATALAVPAASAPSLDVVAAAAGADIDSLGATLALALGHVGTARSGFTSAAAADALRAFAPLLAESAAVAIVVDLLACASVAPEPITGLLAGLTAAATSPLACSLLFARPVLHLLLVHLLGLPSLAPAVADLLVTMVTAVPAGEPELDVLLDYVPWLQLRLDNPMLSSALAGILNLLSQAMTDEAALAAKVRLVFHAAPWASAQAIRELHAHVSEVPLPPPFELIDPAATSALTADLTPDLFILPASDARLALRAHRPVSDASAEHAANLFHIFTGGDHADFEPAVVAAAGDELLAMITAAPLLVKVLLGSVPDLPATLVAHLESARPARAAILLWILAFALGYAPAHGARLTADVDAASTLLTWLLAADPAPRAAAVYVFGVMLFDPAVLAVGLPDVAAVEDVADLVPPSPFVLAVPRVLHTGFTLPFGTHSFDMVLAPHTAATHAPPLALRLVTDALDAKTSAGMPAPSTLHAWDLTLVWREAWRAIALSPSAWHLACPTADLGPDAIDLPDMDVVAAAFDLASAAVAVAPNSQDALDFANALPRWLVPLWASPVHQVSDGLAASELAPAQLAALLAARAVYYSLKALTLLLASPSHTERWSPSTWEQLACGAFDTFVAPALPHATRTAPAIHLHGLVARTGLSTFAAILAAAPGNLGRSRHADAGTLLFAWARQLLAPGAPASITTVGLNAPAAYSKRPLLADRLAVIEALARRAAAWDGPHLAAGLDDKTLSLVVACLGGLMHDQVSAVRATAWRTVAWMVADTSRAAPAFAAAHPRLLVEALELAADHRSPYGVRASAYAAAAALLLAAPDQVPSRVWAPALEALAELLAEPTAPPAFVHGAARMMAALVSVASPDDAAHISAVALQTRLWSRVLDLASAASFVSRSQALLSALGLAGDDCAAAGPGAAWKHLQAASSPHAASLALFCTALHGLAASARETRSYLVATLPLVPTLISLLASPGHLHLAGKSAEYGPSLAAYVGAHPDAFTRGLAGLASAQLVGACGRLLAFAWQELRPPARATICGRDGRVLALALALAAGPASASLDARVGIALAVAACLGCDQPGSALLRPVLDEMVSPSEVDGFWLPHQLEASVIPGALLGSQLLALYRELHTSDVVFAWSVPHSLHGLAALEAARAHTACALAALWLGSDSSVELAALAGEFISLRREASEAMSLVTKLDSETARAGSELASRPGLTSMTRSLAVAQVLNTLALLKAGVLRVADAKAQAIEAGVITFVHRALARITSTKWPTACEHRTTLVRACLGLVANLAADSPASLRAIAEHSELLRALTARVESPPRDGTYPDVLALLGELARGSEVRAQLLKTKIDHSLAAVVLRGADGVERTEKVVDRELAPVLNFWISFTSCAGGAERATKVRGLFGGLHRIALSVPHSEVGLAALKVVRNMAHCREAKVHFLEAGRLAGLTRKLLVLPMQPTPEADAEAATRWALVTDALWALVYASQKIKVALNKIGVAKTLELIEAYMWRRYGPSLEEASPELAAEKRQRMTGVAWYASIDATAAEPVDAAGLATLAKALEASTVVRGLLHQRVIN
ncbi:uncharacterized protein AMSG_01992 [Thecamonas trahens ATCC 50062]|uniref:Rotatin N-terminal domain-containing protein n=1 Tax=Thecamonas trahens ATCC 50062 TaxID=461836 RepID=A0A0L0DWR3_THETB|nr:hypothetical protein AMSG_01992 [Thecamonas trahens ATCC 50062]KNC55978.1 hypothetical protein AMSG_01992 [Thecamonas trahens ATCC 50062]|eukprot:XP_013761025.1 hypothetical protein AMSG_01992 [Thecamonas trahens ATCC 50062]